MLANSGHIPLGYYKDEEKTAATFPVIDGVRYAVPGDLASVDANGFIAVYGRGSVSINSGGEKIFPEEVEKALKRHPAVFDATVVGTPNERFGSQVTAVVELRPEHVADPPDLSDLQAHCRLHLAGYKVPRAVVFVRHRSVAVGQARLPVGQGDRAGCYQERFGMTSTGHGACLTTCSLTEPRNMRAKPVRPCEPTTTTSTPRRSAT